MGIAFFPALMGMMTALTAAQHSKHQRLWLCIGLALFAVCAAILLNEIGISLVSLKRAIATIRQ